MAYTFDCVNKVVQLSSTDDLDLQDLYSRWKDEVLTTISGCDQFMRVVKEPLVGATNIGPYYFIMNNWQIRPFDASYVLNVSGTIIQDEATQELAPFKLDDLTSTVSLNQITAIEVQQVEIPSATSPSEVADAVWDEVLTGASHNLPTSAGRRLRQVSAWLSAEGNLVGTPTDTTLQTDLAEATSSFYADQTLVLISGPQAGQARIVTSYDGTTKTITVDEPFTSAPAPGDEFAIFANHVHSISQVQNGLATKKDVFGVAIL